MIDAERRRFVDRAVLRLSLVELWERYSYFTLFGLLPLFVAAPVAAGGLGWSDGSALRFFGMYLFLIQVAPLLGGFIADQWLGGRASLRAGALMLLLGHGAMALLTLIPHFAGPAVAAALAAAHAPLASWSPPAGPAHGAYLAITSLFYSAVALIAFGNGLFKPVLTVVVGRLPHRGDAERNAAFTTFFLYLNIGGLLSLLLGGVLAQRFGWGWAFGTSAAGMVVALVTMSLVSRTYIVPFTRPDEQAGSAIGGEAGPQGGWVPLAIALALFVLVCVFSYQSYGFVNLFTARLVDRRFFGLEVPPSWFTAVNPIAIMVLTPLLVALWKRGRVGHDASSSSRVGASLLVMALAFALLLVAAAQVNGGKLASPIWVITGIALIALGELLFTPALTAAITRLSPPGRRSLGMGALTASAGVGAWLSGLVGALAIEGSRTAVLGGLASVAALVGALLIAARRGFARLSL